MNGWQLSCVVGAMTAITLAGIFQIAGMQPGAVRSDAPAEVAFSAVPANTTFVAKLSAAPPNPVVEAKLSEIAPSAMIEAEFDAAVSTALAPSDVPVALSHGRLLRSAADSPDTPPPEREEASLQQDRSSSSAEAADTVDRELPYLRYYPYSEIPPKMKPADIVLESLRNIPVGTPLQEIKRAADAFGLNYNFMKAVAKIESDFDPKERTGSYIGLFQLSKYEFAQYGSGDITSPRDNAIAAAYKFVTEAALFELETHRKPTLSDLYLIHQQGWQGAVEHVSHPKRIAWKSMCATEEGKDKGEKWCKRAIWGNTLPAVKRTWKTVDHLTSGAFVAMWRDRLDTLYARYAEASAEQAKQ